MRDKVTTLFNKNHIRFTKTEFATNSGSYYWEYNTKETDNIKRDAAWVCRKKSGWTKKIVRKESPLGFWYDVEEKTYIDPLAVNTNVSGYTKSSMTTYLFVVGPIQYELSFLDAYNGKRVDNEVRPWELNDKPMEDHFIFDLFDELDKVLKPIANKKYNYIDHAGEDGLAYSSHGKFENGYPFFNEHARHDLMRKIFGDERGPVAMQTNEEKILAAGFDLKTSFRKDKETKK